MFNVQKLQRFALASALATGLVSVGVAAGAQGVTPVSTTSTSTSNVALSTTTTHVDRAAELAQANADARRIAFRHMGTSL